MKKSDYINIAIAVMTIGIVIWGVIVVYYGEPSSGILFFTPFIYLQGYGILMDTIEAHQKDWAIKVSIGYFITHIMLAVYLNYHIIIRLSYPINPLLIFENLVINVAVIVTVIRNIRSARRESKTSK